MPRFGIAGTRNDADALKFFREHYVENVERMFAAVGDLYAQYWNDFFHFALFENGERCWDDAFRATHRKYMDALRITEARNIVDLGCGRGGFASVLAQNTSGNVLGIDLSRSQLSHCARFRRPNLSFRRHDIMNIHEIGETFDAISFLDAECYLPDKCLAVERIAGVMQSGGRFLLVAWCKEDGLNRTQEELALHPLMRYWGIPNLATPQNYKRYFAQSGLLLLEEIDLNDIARPNWELGYTQALKGLHEFSRKAATQLIWKGIELGADGIRLIEEQFPAAVYIKVGFDAGFLRYRYFLLEKP